MMAIDVGVGLPVTNASGAEGRRRLVRAAQTAEHHGLDHVSISDLLIGDGTPTLESIVAATVTAAVTERVKVEFGVLVLPAREVTVLAAQLASLQHVSGNRVVLGVGAGGFPKSPLWRAAGAPQEARGSHLDLMLQQLPGLIAGQPTTLGDAASPVTVTLAPPAPPPPILVGGHSEHALNRAARLGDGWFPSLMTPTTLQPRIQRLHQDVAQRGRPRPRVHFGTHAILGADSRERTAALVDSLIEDLGMKPEDAAAIPIAGGPHQVAEHLAAYQAVGVDSITLALDGEGTEQQIEIVGQARALLRA